MQTFLPYQHPRACALVLDQQRLGKQRVECLQILNTLTGRSNGWWSHPAVLMWRGYEPQLLAYSLTICEVWRERGFNDTVLDTLQLIGEVDGIEPDFDHLPAWCNEALCWTHRSNLIRKWPEWYRRFFGDAIPDDLDYIWPV